MMFFFLYFQPIAKMSSVKISTYEQMGGLKGCYNLLMTGQVRWTDLLLATGFPFQEPSDLHDAVSIFLH